ncbi:uncharacterized protein Dwil_GK14722 [Drosophila willistoni]|uniref:E3 ubiquitin-protein ligase PPP1R11 n=1 Tax=Drosophila willistoni TaxID=7260 RepID=B4MUX3_DROWI|nr:uncharacterized protein ZK945.8 [Drosophila willistoni]EDW76318.1 uncharacterized protein Dwil_GK14722 [Drosophila willistoni]
MAQKPIAETGSSTKTLDEGDANKEPEAPTLLLRLEQPRDERRVVFHAGVIDNEHMNRKKSKCCCIYRKPLAFGESSSEDDEDCEHCFGHPERRKKNSKNHNHDHSHDHGDESCPLARSNEDPSTSTQAATAAAAAASSIPSDTPAPTQEAPTPDEFERLAES